MSRNIDRRLSKLESERLDHAPTHIFADRPMAAGEGEAMIANWRELVAAGEASVSGCVLFVLAPEPMTVAEWERAHGRAEALN